MYRHTTRTDGVPEHPNSIVDLGYHALLYSDLDCDFNYDDYVDATDLQLFLLEWLQECSFPYWCHERDLNKDGIVNNFDLALFNRNYGETETKPPTPNPMLWLVPPAPNSTSAIHMIAVTAYDNSTGPDVEYQFECVLGDGHDRGWDPCEMFVDTGLVAGNEYGYRVRARDMNPVIPDDGTGEPGNKTEWSVVGYAVPQRSLRPNPMTWSIEPHATSPNYFNAGQQCLRKRCCGILFQRDFRNTGRR
jgi:hypothetical protein